MRLTIDAEMCTGHGRCYTLSPQLLSDDEEALSPSEARRSTSRRSRGAARDAALSCPEGAISIDG